MGRLMGHLKLHCISIHALLAESDHQSRVVSRQTAQFLSTLSLRRATLFFYAFDFEL